MTQYGLTQRGLTQCGVMLCGLTQCGVMLCGLTAHFDCETLAPPAYAGSGLPSDSTRV